MPKTKSTVYFTKIKTSKTGKYLKFWERKNSRLSGCLLARLLTWYWQRNFPREFTENCFAIFEQSNRVILLTLYCRLYFFPWIPVNPLNGSAKDFLSNLRGVNMIQFRSISVSFGNMYFLFLFPSLNVRASENFLLVRCSIRSLVIRFKGQNFTFFYMFFFCLNPLRLDRFIPDVT